MNKINLKIILNKTFRKKNKTKTQKKIKVKTKKKSLKKKVGRPKIIKKAVQIKRENNKEIKKINNKNESLKLK